MKFLWLTFLALSTLLLFEAAKAETESETTVKGSINENVIENKLLREEDNYEEHDDDDEDEEDEQHADVSSNEDGDNKKIIKEQENQKTTQELINNEDISAFENQPEMHRLARRLKDFHNANNLAGNTPEYQLKYFYPIEVKDEEEPQAEERAIRRRVRIRRRNIKNKAKRTNRNNHIANRRKIATRNSQNSLRPKVPQRSVAKRPTRTNRRKTNKKTGYIQAGLRRSSKKQSKRKNAKSNKRRSFNSKSGQKQRRLNKSKKTSVANKKRKTVTEEKDGDESPSNNLADDKQSAEAYE